MKNLNTPISRNKRRGAFTLIEILIVIGILSMLLALTSPIIGMVGGAQNRARAKSDISLIATALEAFKGRFSIYPLCNAAEDEITAAKNLYKCLDGKLYPKAEGGVISFVDAPKGMKPFLDRSKMNVCSQADRYNRDLDFDSLTDVFLADPWLEPYLYFYDTNNIVGERGSWRNPGFILMSKGQDNKAVQVGDMYTSGMMPDEDSYRTPVENVDNIVFGFDD